MDCVGGAFSPAWLDRAISAILSEAKNLTTVPTCFQEILRFAQDDIVLDSAFSGLSNIAKIIDKTMTYLCLYDVTKSTLRISCFPMYILWYDPASPKAC
jgi:hypothetical protein